MNREKIIDLAIKALIYEVSITPKPGLVSKTSLGSHRDMNFYTFLESAFALRKYFSNCYSEATNLVKEKELFDRIRKHGQEAEADMFLATNNVNTHKGSIFSLGIVFTCLVNYYYFHNTLPSYDDLNQKIKLMCKDIYSDFDKKKFDSYGKKIYDKYSIKGAREQAYRGYDIVLCDGITKLKKYLKIYDLECSAILLLLYYISILDDTNIINRKDIETLEDIKNKCKDIWKKYNKLNFKREDFIDEVEDLNTYFISKNVSPGGSADLLILTLFILFIYEVNYV